MCGITGIVATTANGRSALAHCRQATDRLNHRGPDHQEVCNLDVAALGHCRLSVLDPTAGAHQPMTDTQDRYVIVYNGECYNFKSLREELTAKGHAFRTDSDTEVILNLYIEYGEAFVEKVNGFFALAIFDKHDHTLFLARDRMGIKPLYIFSSPDFFCFASEAKAILAYPVPRTIDTDSLHLYLHLNYIPGAFSMIKGLEQLPPGHSGILKKGQWQTRCWYTIPEANVYDGQDQIKRFREAMEASVRSRLVSDVPLGAFLSGGMDSAIISALAAKETKNLQTFTIGFKDHPEIDESREAELTAKHIGSDHTTFHIQEDDLQDSARHLLTTMDDPFADSSAIAVHVLSRFVRTRVTVALSGDGSDEMLGGYRKHKAEWLARHNRWPRPALPILDNLSRRLPHDRTSRIGDLNRKWLKYLEGLQLSPKERYWRWCGFTSGDMTDKLCLLKSTNMVSERISGITLGIDGRSSDLEDILLADMRTVLPNDMLTKTDRMSMACGLEVRVPFLDHHVVKIARELPFHLKYRKERQKWILGTAFADLLPAEIFDRPKKGFEVPIRQWLNTSLKEDVDRVLSHDFLQAQGIFQYEEVTHLLNQSRSTHHAGDAPARIWGLLVFQHWWEKTFN
ncbi:MAG: asparagine synthase (glutamine-hydrolyzing) [Flavobacteriales bacterium]|nr:asparagine synthase (glutamine-hydrolyzing) [Flavobacteriales bacterium]